MTWGEIKRKIEEKVKDGDEIDSIDIKHDTELEIDQYGDKSWLIFNILRPI